MARSRQSAWWRWKCRRGQWIWPLLVAGLVTAGLVTACQSGTAYNPLNNNQRIPDGALSADAGVHGDGGPTDAGPLPDGTVSPGDAAPADAAPGPDAATGCLATGCQANAFCNTTTDLCECLTGFLDDGAGNCLAINPGDPAARSQADMCQRWTADHQITAYNVWTPGGTTCDPGTLSTAGIADAIAFINVYRYLCGLSPLADDLGLNEDAQYCAIIQEEQGFLDHTPDPSAPCYTSQGASAASASNLALGPSTPAGAIDLFIDDSGVSSLGHRRWTLNPSYGPAGVGFAGNATCLYVFSWSNTSNVDFVAWPNQGFTPASVIPGTWSFGSVTYSISSQTQVSVLRVSDQANLTVSYSLLPAGYALPTIGFSPSGWSPQAGEIYEVSIIDPATGPLVVYQVKPVSCP